MTTCLAGFTVTITCSADQTPERSGLGRPAGEQKEDTTYGAQDPLCLDKVSAFLFFYQAPAAGSCAHIFQTCLISEMLLDACRTRPRVPCSTLKQQVFAWFCSTIWGDQLL